VAGPLVAILGTRYRDFSIEEAVLSPLGVTLVGDPGGSPEAIVEIAKSARVVLAGSGPRFDETVLGSLDCVGIVRYGVGTDSIDLDAARRLGIAVARVSDYGTEAVAFHAVAAAAVLVRRIPEADRSIRSGRWGFADLRPLHVPSELAAGVVGFGRIGQQVARYLTGLGFSVCAYDPYVDISVGSGVRSAGLENLLADSDVVLLHAPGNQDGSPLLNRDRLCMMRPGSVLVNTARGSLIDIEALVCALRDGRPARAALDVYPTEPVDVGVFSGVEDQVLLTPHMAWYTEESEADMRQKAADEAARLLRGQPLRDPVVEPEQRKATS
jgi:D-3-phosphoglycerate dehydrogenase